MTQKQTIAMFAVLCLIALGLGYLYGLRMETSREIAVPVVVTNVVTNIVRVNPQSSPTPVKSQPTSSMPHPMPIPINVAPNSPTGAAAIEAGIRKELKGASTIEQVKHIDLTGKKLTDVGTLARLKGLEVLWLPSNNLTDISALAGLKQLERLSLEDNPALTKAHIAELQKALPKCKIYSNPTK